MLKKDGRLTYYLKARIQEQYDKTSLKLIFPIFEVCSVKTGSYFYSHIIFLCLASYFNF
jgi:hypothetical protein